MITMLTPVDRLASIAVRRPADRSAPALSEVAGSVAGPGLRPRGTSAVMRDAQGCIASVAGTQPVPTIVQHDVTDFGTSTKVQDPPRGVPV